MNDELIATKKVHERTIEELRQNKQELAIVAGKLLEIKEKQMCELDEAREEFDKFRKFNERNKKKVFDEDYITDNNYISNNNDSIKQSNLLQTPSSQNRIRRSDSTSSTSSDKGSKRVIFF